MEKVQKEVTQRQNLEQIYIHYLVRIIQEAWLTFRSKYSRNIHISKYIIVLNEKA